MPVGPGHRALRLLTVSAGIGLLTLAAHNRLNPTSIGLGYLLYVLFIASTWGFTEALLASILATLSFNFFFLPPVGTFTIADPQNWVALFSFLVASLIASRLSARANERTEEALARQQDLERLYAFSRSILLIDDASPFPTQLTQKLTEIFDLRAAVLYDRRSGALYRAGPDEFEGTDDELREAAIQGSVTVRIRTHRVVIGAVRLGSEPIASLGLQGIEAQDSVLQGIANLVAIGLERARAQALSLEVEAAAHSEQLRTALIDAMAHELKTPLTSIKAATTSLISNPDQPAESRMELTRIAVEETEHLQRLIENTVEMARLDTARIDVRREAADPKEIVGDVVATLQHGIESRTLEFGADDALPPMALDKRLIRLALKQLIDNAHKYSPPGRPIRIHVYSADKGTVIDVTDCGEGIPAAELRRIFDRFYRSPSVQRKIPGSGLGLSIAHRIVSAHGGTLTVSSRPGETVFRMMLPSADNERNEGS